MNSRPSGWKAFVRRHPAATAFFVIAGALVFAWSIFVFIWYALTAQSSGLVPATLGLWSTSNLVAFLVYATLWELVLAGAPLAVVGLLGWLWWRKLPQEEKGGYHFGGQSRSAGGGGISLLFFIAFCIKVYVDGNWNEAISTFSLNYVVGSFVTILLWGLVVVGIPAAIFLAWWLKKDD